jgi:folate-dependent phosphoribosylglycinamide formyltransferase PurN
MMRVALLAPIANSLYSRLVAHLAASERDVELVAIVVRTPWSADRIKSEFRRDGARLIAKVRTKLLVGEEQGASDAADFGESIAALAKRVGLDAGTLKDFAAKKRIPYLRVADHNAPAAIHALRAAAPDAIAFTGGGMIRRELLEIPRVGIMNCHAGMLPQYRGMDVVEWPAAEGRLDDPGLGLTLHLMESGLDTGPILLQKRIELRPGDGFASIRGRMAPEMVALMIEGIRGLRDRAIEPKPQEPRAGRQYYVMHPRVLAHAARRLMEQVEQVGGE